MSLTNNSQEKCAPMAQPELGNLIKEARKAKKLSQRQLGEQLGVSYQTIANWENGLRAPIEADLKRLTNIILERESSCLSQKIRPFPNSVVRTNGHFTCQYKGI